MYEYDSDDSSNYATEGNDYSSKATYDEQNKQNESVAISTEWEGYIDNAGYVDNSDQFSVLSWSGESEIPISAQEENYNSKPVDYNQNSSIRTLKSTSTNQRAVPELISIYKVHCDQNENLPIWKPFVKIANNPLENAEDKYCENVPNFATHPMQYVEYIKKRFSGVLFDRTNLGKK